MKRKLTKILMGLAALAALALGGSALAGAAGSGGGNQAVQEQGEASEPADDVQDENGQDDAQEGEEGGGNVSAGIAARASEAALAETGGGKVNAIERDDEKGATYEVEVATTDGRQVDVRLDDQFKVVAVDADGE